MLESETYPPRMVKIYLNVFIFKYALIPKLSLYDDLYLHQNIR